MQKFNLKNISIIIFTLFYLSACQSKKSSIYKEETKNITFDKDFEKNYFSEKIIDDLITHIREKNIDAILDISHPNLKKQLSKKDGTEYFEMISLFYGKLELVTPSLNTKIGKVSNINLKAKYSKMNTDLKLIFIENENKEIKLGSISILPIEPQLDTIETICKPIIKLIKEKNANELYKLTTNKFQDKFSNDIFNSALNKHFDTYDFLENFSIKSHSIGLMKKGRIVLSVEHIFEFKKGHYKKVLLWFQREDKKLKLINVDFSNKEYENKNAETNG